MVVEEVHTLGVELVCEIRVNVLDMAKGKAEHAFEISHAVVAMSEVPLQGSPREETGAFGINAVATPHEPDVDVVRRGVMSEAFDNSFVQGNGLEPLDEINSFAHGQSDSEMERGCKAE